MTDLALRVILAACLQEDEVLDTILLAAGVVGLLLTIAYAYACERM
jgi:hypothetical protein